jgi:hypothetical protein
VELDPMCPFAGAISRRRDRRQLGLRPGQMPDVMAAANAPVDVIGTGSYLPELWSETYATADIVAYDGRPTGQGRPRIPAE